jgi:hypothetical protein
MPIKYEKSIADRIKDKKSGMKEGSKAEMKSDKPAMKKPKAKRK